MTKKRLWKTFETPPRPGDLITVRRDGTRATRDCNYVGAEHGHLDAPRYFVEEIYCGVIQKDLLRTEDHWRAR